MNVVANFRWIAALAGFALLMWTEGASAQESVSKQSNVIALNSLSTVAGIGAEAHLPAHNNSSSSSYAHDRVLGRMAERDGAVLLLAAGAFLILVRNRRLLA
jgi:hypothetical protein